MGRGEKLQGSQLIDYLQLLDNEGKTRVNHPFGNGLNPTYKMMIWGWFIIVLTTFPVLNFFFPQQQNFTMGSSAQISSGVIRCASTPGSGQGSGGSGADTL